MDNLMAAAQVIFGLCIVILLYVITLVLLNIDALVASRNVKVVPRESTTIVDGWIGAGRLANVSYNTINPFTEDYMKIGKSINTHGGAQFTYQFWIRMEDVGYDALKNQIILMKGSNKKYKLGYYNPQTLGLIEQPFSNEYLIKCPLIKFGDNHKELVVEFNTNKDISYSSKIQMKTDADPSSKRNALSLLPLGWYLFTFVFEDTFSALETTEIGSKFTFYLNDFPYHIVSASSDARLRNNFIKQNEGGLHILPDMKNPNDFIKLANIKYYNYAITPKEISKLFEKGPPKHAANDVKNTIPKPAYLSAYNKMDIYNF